MNSKFFELQKREGKYALITLIHLYDDDGKYNLYFCNDVEDITYDGNVYSASTFTYKETESEDGFEPGGSLEITVLDNDVIDLSESVYNLHCEATKIKLQDSQIDVLYTNHHHYGTLKGDAQKISYSFESDDRADMTFPALIWNTLNNRGNA